MHEPRPAPRSRIPGPGDVTTGATMAMSNAPFGVAEPLTSLKTNAR